MADSRDPEKRRAPVRKRLPMLALEKSKREVGRSFLTISRLTTFKKLRMSSFLGAICCSREHGRLRQYRAIRDVQQFRLTAGDD